MKRAMYRKQVAIGAARPVIKKGQKYRKDHTMASSFDKAMRNDSFGFACLHMSVSESIGAARVRIENKHRTETKVGVRTRDDTATKDDDFIAIDEIVSFGQGEAFKEIEIRIIDDHGWEPDEDFYVELYAADGKNGDKLAGRDTEVRITILDDDKPGQLAFANPTVRHAATHSDCVINVKRIHDADGEVTVKYKTIEIDSGERTARAGVDFEKTENTLVFKHNETQKEIVVKILSKELAEGEERDEIFGLKLYDPTNGVKISKRDVCHIELVQDAKAARQADAL